MGWSSPGNYEMICLKVDLVADLHAPGVFTPPDPITISDAGGMSGLIRGQFDLIRGHCDLIRGQSDLIRGAI